MRLPPPDAPGETVVDLHCHSTVSDGSEAPRAVAARARAANVAIFALTDHDALDGFDATVGAAPAVLRGIELSCRDRGRSVHVLGYGLGPGPGLSALQARLAEIARRRRERVVRICERLSALGIDLDARAILARKTHGTVGRPAVAQALVEAGAVSSVREAFDRFLHDGGPADVPVPRLGVAEGIELLRAAGAVCNLAHPHVYDDEHLAALLDAHAGGGGLGGLECHYARYTAAERARFLALADRYGLVPTAGSDFHGETVPEVSGVGVAIPRSAARRLAAWLATSEGGAAALRAVA